ncbi:hypothetical protein B0T26DRAFT_605578, partial [Lasiosphaeria miniovina]
KLVAALLADPRVDINTQDSRGRTPLSYAVGRARSIDIVRCLLADRRTDVNRADMLGRTPLAYAVLE